MSRGLFKMAAASAIAIPALLCMQAGASAFTTANVKPGGAAFIVAAKQPKCSASTSEDFEGTDMSGVTPKCQAIFDACVDESLACNVRLKKCAEFDKMDRSGSCYKKQR